MITLTALAAVFAFGGCATAPKTPPPAGIDQMGAPEVLYQAILSTYETREIPIALSSDKFMLVTSEFENVGPNLRRRTNSRVVRAAPGAMGLKVMVEWERRTEIRGEEQWRPIDNQELRKRAKSTEIELGRAIERRFESWKESAAASKQDTQPQDE
jgi:predicted dienelactone hydrolase